MCSCQHSGPSLAHLLCGDTGKCTNCEICRMYQRNSKNSSLLFVIHLWAIEAIHQKQLVKELSYSQLGSPIDFVSRRQLDEEQCSAILAMDHRVSCAEVLEIDVIKVVLFVVVVLGVHALEYEDLPIQAWHSTKAIKRAGRRCRFR